IRGRFHFRSVASLSSFEGRITGSSRPFRPSRDFWRWYSPRRARPESLTDVSGWNPTLGSAAIRSQSQPLERRSSTRSQSTIAVPTPEPLLDFAPEGHPRLGPRPAPSPPILLLLGTSWVSGCGSRSSAPP